MMFAFSGMLSLSHTDVESFRDRYSYRIIWEGAELSRGSVKLGIGGTASEAMTILFLNYQNPT